MVNNVTLSSAQIILPKHGTGITRSYSLGGMSQHYKKNVLLIFCRNISLHAFFRIPKTNEIGQPIYQIFDVNSPILSTKSRISINVVHISSHKICNGKEFYSLPSLRSTEKQEIFDWSSAELHKVGGTPGWDGELVLLLVVCSLEVCILTWWFKYTSKLEEVGPVFFLPLNLPLIVIYAVEIKKSTMLVGLMAFLQYMKHQVKVTSG